MQSNPYQSPEEPDTAALDEGRLGRRIVLEGSMSVRDVLHTQLLILKYRWVYALVCILLYVAFVVALAMLSPSTSLFGNTFLLLGLIGAPAILPFTLLMVCLRLRRDSQRHVGIFAVTESTLSDQGIDARVNDKLMRVPWSAFGSFLDSPRVVLLFLRESRDHLIVSRSKLKRPEDWPMLIEFLHSRFPRS